MSDDHDTGEREHGPPPLDRTTAPQSEYSMSDVGRGIAILLVGLVLVVGIPLVLG